MLDSNLFFKENRENEAVVEIEGISAFRFPTDMDGHKKGDIIPWKLRAMNIKERDNLVKLCTTTKIKKGQRIDNIDKKKLEKMMCAKSIVFPDLRNKDLLKSYDCMSDTQLLEELLSVPGDYDRILMEVLEVNHYSMDLEEDLQEEENISDEVKNV